VKRNWKKRNPLAVREMTRRRTAKLAGVPRVDYGAILQEHAWVCHICKGMIASRADLHFDHVIPLSKGGSHTAENIRPSHALCNLRKSAKLDYAPAPTSPEGSLASQPLP
jgi:5-methylcytosine-specific restriction endonuclease McrA